MTWKSSSLARLAVVLVTAAAAATLAGACADDSASEPPASDGGTSEASLDRAICPKNAPPAGSSCILPEGTTCDFGRCGTRIGQCTRGTWKFGGNAPPAPLCPKDPPAPDEPCPPCWPPEVSCPFGSLDCSAEDASVNTAIASCRRDKWTLDIRPCRDGGGPDVQGDGGPDAD